MEAGHGESDQFIGELQEGSKGQSKRKVGIVLAIATLALLGVALGQMHVSAEAKAKMPGQHLLKFHSMLIKAFSRRELAEADNTFETHEHFNILEEGKDADEMKLVAHMKIGKEMPLS